MSMRVTVAEMKRLGKTDAAEGADCESIAEGIREWYGITYSRAYLQSATAELAKRSK